jgi:ribosome-binding factor A
MSDRTEKMAGLVKELAAEFLSRENNRTSLITVTSANTSPDLKRATIYITVLPEDKENAALEWAKRMRSDFREILKKNLAIKNIPFVDFEIDLGEKNRQKIDILLKQ